MWPFRRKPTNHGNASASDEVRRRVRSGESEVVVMFDADGDDFDLLIHKVEAAVRALDRHRGQRGLRGEQRVEVGPPYVVDLAGGIGAYVMEVRNERP